MKDIDPIIQSIRDEITKELDAVTGTKALRIPVTSGQLKILETVSKSQNLTPETLVLAFISQLEEAAPIDFDAKKSCPCVNRRQQKNVNDLDVIIIHQIDTFVKRK